MAVERSIWANKFDNANMVTNHCLIEIMQACQYDSPINIRKKKNENEKGNFFYK